MEVYHLKIIAYENIEKTQVEKFKVIMNRVILENIDVVRWWERIRQTHELASDDDMAKMLLTL